MVPQEQIKNLLFDLGGVIINLDVPATWQAFQNLAAPNTNSEQLNFDWQMDFLKEYEVGKISSIEFLNQLKIILGKDVKTEVLIQSWNAMLLDIPQSRLKLLTELKKKYRIFLLSNTNELHYQAFQKILLNTHHCASLDFFFHHAYYSHLIGMRKPNVETFQFILDEQKISADTTLFLDDTPMHLEGAAQIGIHTVLVDAKHPIEKILEHF